MTKMTDNNNGVYDLALLLDDRNRPLYDAISVQIPVVLRNSDGDHWGETIRDGSALIFVSPSEYPISCFTHELLHVEQDLAGRARPGFLVEAESETGNDELSDRVNDLLPFAYNQLIHHKMFPRFKELGFPASEFLLAEDANERRGVESDVQRLATRKTREFPRGVPFHALVYPYLWARSPDDTSTEAGELLKQIRKIATGNDYCNAEGLLARFRDNDSLDIRVCLARLFYLCGYPDVAFGQSEQDLVWARDYSQF